HDEHAVGDCDDRLTSAKQPAPALKQPMELALLVAYRRPCTLCQHSLQCSVSIGTAVAHRNASALFPSRAQPGPRGEFPGRGKGFGLMPDLCHDLKGGGEADSRHCTKPLDRSLMLLEQPRDLLVQFLRLPAQLLDLIQRLPQQEAVRTVHLAVQSF